MTCKIDEIKTDFYLPENDEITNFDVDQTIIVKANFLKYLSRYKNNQSKEELDDTLLSDEWYPYVNSYYPYTEDVDAFARVNHLLGSKPSFASLSSAEFHSQTDLLQENIPYSETAAQLKYLESHPFSFIILGKPDIGEQELGKQLADYWQCVYIHPEILVEQEIFSGSRAGQCIEFNLKCGRAIGIDVILRLVEKRVKSESAKHRGFVICGLPLIPNDLYQEDPISSESAVFTVKEIFEEMFDTTMDAAMVAPTKPRVSISSKYKSEDGDLIEEEEHIKEDGMEEEEESEDQGVKRESIPVKLPTVEIPVDIGPDYDVCQIPEIGTNYEDQLNFIFELIKPPFMIIYIMCSSADVIEKRKNYRFDVHSKQTINLQTEMYNNILFNYFSNQENRDEEIHEDFLETRYMNLDTAQMNYMVKLPRHFPANVSVQLDAYHYTGLHFIERRVLMHDPQYFLKVDGRVSVQRMLHIIKSRLKILPIQQVILPIRFNAEPLDIGEGGPQQSQLGTLTLEDWFKELSRRDVPSSIFKWNWSDWGTKCPVALKAGALIDGDSNFAVHFMNKIFFLANEDNFIKFYKNPRPYLLPPYPKSTCKIFVFGPTRSGKTAVSRCLGFLLNGTVLSITDMIASFLVNQEEELKEKIRQAAIAEAMKALNEQRAEEAKLLELQRIEKIKEWVTSTKRLIEDLVSILGQMANDQTITSFEISSFPMAMKKVSMVETETPLAMEFIRVKEQIHSLRIPFSYKIEDWQAILLDKRKLLIYMPVSLRTKVVPKPATVFDEYVVEFAKNAVENVDLHDSTLNNKSLANIIVNHIKSIEEEYVRKGHNKGGWILDGMLCDMLILDEMYPDFMADEVIVLLDEEEPEFLVKNYENDFDTDFLEYRDFFMGIGKLDAAWRSPSKLPKRSSEIRIVREILSEIINDPTLFDYGDGGPMGKVEAYRLEVLNFNEKWAETKKYFSDHSIDPVEVKVTGTSIPDLMKSAIRKVEDMYRVKASPFTELDRAEEVNIFGNQILNKNISEGADDIKDDTFEENRRYGDTRYYCPVTFHEQGVLWKGKEDHAVKFENKLYLLSDEDNMKKFLEIPRNYLIGEPPEAFPPPRICVVGIPGTGKTMAAKALAKNYGLLYVSFESLVKTCFGITTSESFDDLRRSKDTNEALHSYLNVDAPLSEDFLKDEISIGKFWIKQQNMGFVFDDFPKRPSDVTFMAKYKLIPDVIINLTNNHREIKNKIIKDYLKQWELEMNDRRAVIEEDNKMKRLTWEEMRKKRYDELIEEKREHRYLKRKEKQKPGNESSKDRRYLEDLKEVDEETDRSGFRTESQVSFDSVAEQDDIQEVNQALDLELPEPVYKDLLETLDDAIDRFEVLTTDTINIEDEFLKNMKAICTSEVVPFTDVIVSFDDPELTIRNVFVIADKFKFRTKSHFECCYEVSMEVAERLLSCGYFFLSKFGKTCPVQHYEDKNPIQMYIPMEQKYNLFPVIHRSYIYYIVGRDSCIKFKENPLQYILVDTFRFPLITFKVAVTGPPKCGKTVLATRIANEFGFKMISRGQAARYVLTYLPLSHLAKSIESVLRKGWELTDEMVVKSVEAACFDGRAVTQGMVFDGFPNTITEVRHLSYVSLVPNLDIDLDAKQSEIFECLSFDVGRRGLPRFSERFVEHLLHEWLNNSEIYREWFDREYQVTTKLPIATSNWSVWTQSKAYMTAVFFEIKHYFIHAADSWPLRLANMQITPLEFLERAGAFKIYCPCCLHFSNVLKNGGDPPDRTGLVQYKYYFYWLCRNHIEQFMKTPDAFMVPFNNHNLPQNLPDHVNLTNVPDNVFEDGACVVCYKNKGVFVKGIIQFAIKYNEKVYIFDSKMCFREFLRSPGNYMCEINFKPPENYPPLNYEELPVLGMLEQYVAKYVTKALSFVARHRPVIPGLSIHASAVIGIGLHLKIHSAKISEDHRTFYKEGEDLYNQRRKKLIDYLDKMKSVINPFLHYEEPLPEFQVPVSVKSVSSESVGTTITKIVDEIIDNVDYGT